MMVDVRAVGLAAVAAPGEVLYTPVDTRIGGHPIDVAIDLIELGYPADQVAVAAAVGRGPFASFVRDVIARYRFPTFLQDVASDDTGRNVVLEVAGEDRRFHLDPGANRLLDPAHVSAAIAAFKPDLLTVRPGYSGIDLALGEILAPLEDAVVMLDVMQPRSDRPAGYLTKALPFVDIVHCNEGEALINTGAATLDEAVDVFIAAGVELVLVTGGERGARAYTSTHQVTQPGFRVDVVDATGCGDAFCAGAIGYLAQTGRPTASGVDGLAELLLRAQAAGASAATAVGCVEGVTAATVASILAEQGSTVRSQTSERDRL
jgi:sugar/nucleoside kinase (ribokinase family)